MAVILSGEYIGGNDVNIADCDVDFVYSGDGCAFHDLLRIMSDSKFLDAVSIPEKWKRAWSSLCRDKQPNWRRFVGESMFDTWIDSVKYSVEKRIKNLNQFSDYYIKCLVQCRNFVDSLEKAKIDIEYYNSLRNSNVSSLYSFEPNELGFAGKPVYSLSSTKTGRLTILRGPNILTLQKNHRKLLKSRFKDGTILYCDIGQFEVRVAMSQSMKSVCEDDIYSDIAVNCGIKIDRDHAKKIILSLLFGAHTSTIKKELNLSASDAVAMVDAIRKYVGLRKIEKWIKDNRIDWQSKTLYNAFGRPIDVSEKNVPIVNYYVQSTSSELALLAFKKFVSKMNREFAVPIFVQHDALYIDCTSEYIDEVKSIVNTMSWNGSKFPVNVSIVS